MLNKHNYEKKSTKFDLHWHGPQALAVESFSHSKQSHDLGLKKPVHLLNLKSCKLFLGKGYSAQYDDLGFHQINVTRYAL